jgi:hypothetical protein
MPERLTKGFLRELMAAWGAPVKPWRPRVPKKGMGPHAGRLATEAAGNVATGKWSRGRAQSELDRSLRAPPTQTRAAPGSRGFGGGGFTGGVSSRLGAAPAAAWVAPKPPRLAKATTPGNGFSATPPLPLGDAAMFDDATMQLVRGYTATARGRAHFDSVMTDMEKIAGIWVKAETRSLADEVLEKWATESPSPLRKAISSAWLARARAIVAGASGAYRRGADKTQAFGSRMGAALARGTKGHAAAVEAGRKQGEEAMAARLAPRRNSGPGFRGFGPPTGEKGPIRHNVPGASGPGFRGFGPPTGAKGPIRHQPSQQDLQAKAIRNAGNNSAGVAGRAYLGGAARRTGNAARMAYHGAAGAAAAGATGAAGYGAATLTDKEREQRRAAAKARWANRGGGRGFQKGVGADGLEKKLPGGLRARLIAAGAGLRQMGRNVAADAMTGVNLSYRISDAAARSSMRNARTLGAREGRASGLGAAVAGLTAGPLVAPMVLGTVALGATARGLRSIENVAAAAGARIGARRAARTAAKAGAGEMEQTLAGVVGAAQGARKARAATRLSGTIALGVGANAAVMGAAVLTDKQIEQRRAAARARWANHTRSEA